MRGLDWVGAILLFVAGCSANDGQNGPAANSGGSGSGGAAGSGGTGTLFCNSCLVGQYQPCDANGNPLDRLDCSAQGLNCVPDQGCLACTPGSTTCVGNDVHECPDGNPGNYVETCDAAAGAVCNNGACKTECEAAADNPSNVGCEFWAVDLPNERIVTLTPPSAADGAWGVILANAGVTPANVTIERNVAPPGQPLQLEVVETRLIQVGEVAPFSLPQAEIVGPTVMEPPGPPGSQLTSNAFRITTTAPVVAYQFNNFTNAYSNDASLLLPRAGLGTLHRALGYGPAKPIAIPGIPFPGVPERAFVTVVGVNENTQVRVLAGGEVNTDGAIIPNMQPGDIFETTIGPFDVLNIASNGNPGDLTGTVVETSQPAAVFYSTETSIIGRPDMPQPEPGEDDGVCCTDHLEEQIFPVTALGTRFVVTRSVPRGTSDIEPDLLRFLGVAEPATVTTNLPGADAQFTLQPGELREVWVKEDVVVEASAPISVGQLLVSQTTTQNYEGDPSLTIFPPLEQYRAEYAFLIPPSWPKNFVVIASSATAQLQIDGQPISGCEQVPVGNLAGIDWVANRCPLAEGVHRITGTEAFGITVYGYSGPGSFAFSGGADVKPVYAPPPIF